MGSSTPGGPRLSLLPTLQSLDVSSELCPRGSLGSCFQACLWDKEAPRGRSNRPLLPLASGRPSPSAVWRVTHFCHRSGLAGNGLNRSPSPWPTLPQLPQMSGPEPEGADPLIRASPRVVLPQRWWLSWVRPSMPQHVRPVPGACSCTCICGFGLFLGSWSAPGWTLGRSPKCDPDALTPTPAAPQ